MTEATQRVAAEKVREILRSNLRPDFYETFPPGNWILINLVMLLHVQS